MINKMVLKLKVRIAEKDSNYGWEKETWLRKTFKNIERNKYGEVPTRMLQEIFEKEISNKYKLYSTEGIDINIIDED
jgi:hypothetical protein